MGRVTHPQTYIDQVTVTGINGSTSNGNGITEVFSARLANTIGETMSLYPNPVHDVLHVKSLNNSELNYRIMNMNGQVIIDGKTKDKIDVSILRAGIYFIEMNDGEDIITKKFMKL